MTEGARSAQLTAVDHRWSGVPSGWAAVSASDALAVRERVLDAVQAASTLEGLRRLEASAAPKSLHPVHLLGLWPNGPTFEANDLLVVGLVGHTSASKPASPSRVRKVHNVGRIARALRAVPNDRSACMAGAETLLFMGSPETSVGGF